MNLFSQAETLLLEALGLKDFKPNEEGVNVKSFKESFLATGRLDAEYYQRKYEDVMNRIITQKHKRIADVVTIKKSVEPGSDAYDEEGLPFLRVSDYNKFGISEPTKKLSESFCNANRELVNKLKPKKESILFSKDGSVGTAYMLRNDANFITSGAVLHLTVKDKKTLIPEYLTLVLNSKLVQMQAERDAGGSIILHWRVSEIENVVVPIIELEKQQEIAALVEESFRLKKQSEQLLEMAKRAVEVAVEEGEERGMAYIDSQQKNI
ncbi:MAG: restriction endonuclease subunit S [Bacteroidales bacterium]|nr:restriction endonuclease subunit S [Bacteroidales bacterium]